MNVSLHYRFYLTSYTVSHSIGIIAKSLLSESQKSSKGIFTFCFICWYVVLSIIVQYRSTE